jgi:hypothetical protein
MKGYKPILILIITAAVALISLGSSCRKPKQSTLPANQPQVTKQEFTGPQEGFPPQVKGRTNVTAKAAEERSAGLTDALVTQTRAAALQDQSVRALLGARSAYITTDEVDPEKGQTLNPNGALATRVTFFSYTNNVAVIVRMNGLKVETATRVDNYQPAEGSDEIKEAIDLASRDRQLLGKLTGLTGHAILTLNTRGQGHRMLRVTFRQGDEDVPRYFANVDLTDQKVVSAGPVTTENREGKQ